MSVNSSFLIFILFFIKYSTSVDEFCQMKRDVIRQEYETLLQIFNLSAPTPPPSKCDEYLDEIYNTVDVIDQDSFIDQIQTEDFKEARRQYEIDRDHMETSFTKTKADLEDQFNTNLNQISNNIKFTRSEIDRISAEEKNAIKKHQDRVKTYDKCGYQPETVNKSRKSTFKSNKHLKTSDEPVVLCNVPSQWFLDLKTLMDTKVYSPEDLLPTDDCNKKRRWFLKVNSIFQEAIDQLANSYDIETYKATLQKRLTDRQRAIDDTINQLKKDNERALQEETNFLQQLNAELQKVKSHYEDVVSKQNDELEVMAMKLMRCSLYDLANKLIDDVDTKGFMKQVFIREYETSSKNDKSENLMYFLATVDKVCRKFEGYIILYDTMTSKNDQESPAMIEIINQIRNLRQPGASCGVEYDPNNFLSPTLESDPLVQNIIDIFSDSIKVGNSYKVIKFNYNYIMTFQQIVSTLVSKSYTGSNLKIMLDFKDELYWLVHKYDVLNQLLDIKPPTSKDDKKMYKDSVDITANSDALYNEDTDRLIGLREKMRRLGIE
jgi:hypothetical protein